MSVKAFNWAARLNIQKSSNKFVLLMLANHVDHRDPNWECYASISYLTAATSLNRKTVIAALNALREQGYIKKTDKMGGPQKNIPIYVIDYHTEWPQIDIKRALAWLDHACQSSVGKYLEPIRAALSEETEKSEENNKNIEKTSSETQNVTHKTPELKAPTCPKTALEIARSALRRSLQDKESARLMRSAHLPVKAVEKPVIHQARSALKPVAGLALNLLAEKPKAITPLKPVKTAETAASAAWNGQRPPENWSLPQSWHTWALHHRQWTPERVQQVAEVFYLYWRSKPDSHGVSDDWEARWRLWVMRENDARVHAPRRPQAAWWHTQASLDQKAAELGISRALPGEQLAHYRDRIQRSIEHREH